MANDFSQDPTCVALYDFEDGALETDSQSTNTLTNVNTVVANTVDFKQGAASADFELASAQYFARANADLTADFPGKSGTTNKSFTFAAWMMQESLATSGNRRTLVAKYDTGGNNRSYLAYIAGSTDNFASLAVGYNGGASAELVAHASDLVIDTWYHITFTFDNDSFDWSIRVRDTNGDVVGTDATGTMTLDVNGLSIETTEFRIGEASTTASDFMDGEIDELVIFNRAITEEEAQQITDGTFGAADESIVWYAALV